MEGHRHFLLVIHAAARNDTPLLEEAQRCLSEGPGNKLSALLVVPAVPTAYFQLPSSNDLEAEIIQEAQIRLNHICDQLQIPEAQRWVRMGQLRHEVRSLTRALHVDEIITDRASHRQILHAQQQQRWLHLPTPKEPFARRVN